MKHVDRLPGPQARALRAAFGEAEGDGDRFLVFLGALSLLAEASEHSPVLALVDDAHWLDDASGAALLFVARRVSDERIALLFGAREGDLRTFDSGDLPSLTLEGVDDEGAGVLLTERTGVVVPLDVRHQLVRATGGNPLALAEVADALSPEQLAGLAPLPAQLPLTEGVERAFLNRYRRLPEAAKAFLLVAAADDSGRVATVRRAAATLDAGEEALHHVEQSGLLHVRDGSLVLRHPLVRSAVYGAATSFERRRAHRALAEALVGIEDADRRAWHLAAAVEEPDDAVVAELDRAAERARARGGHEAAAAAWERAAELSAQSEPRATRLYAAARAAWLAAQPGRARALANAASTYATEPGLRADIARLQARIEWNTGSLHTGHRMILEAAREVAPHDPDRAREMAMFGAALASFGADSGVNVDPATLVPVPPPTDTPRRRAFSGLLIGLDQIKRGKWADAARTLRETFTLFDELEPDDLDLLPNLGIAAMHLGEDELALTYHSLLLARARATGAVVMILYSLTRRGLTELATGQWTSLNAGASEALPLAQGSGQPGLGALALSELTLVAALRGEDTYEERVAETERIAAAHSVGIVEHLLADFLRWAKGVHNARHAETAIHHLEQISPGPVRLLAALDRLDAAVRADRRDQARTWTDELAAFAAATGTPWIAAAAEHGEALLADDAEAAESHFEQALDHHRKSLRVPDRARTELAYGEFLRRARRRVDARTHLRAALEIFEDLGAAPMAERARQELRASGETARRRDPSTASKLTPQELQVAALIRQGMSNREAAAQLFLSPRTIDFHLRNVFAKLGVTSRAELAVLALD
jgi:DNA-binding CsgD family transcriptional regulator